MKFYYVYYTTYHNGTCIGTDVGKILTDEEPKEEAIELTWQTLNDWYKKNGVFCMFNIWHFNKGRRVSFFHEGLFPKKNERDIKEWKEELNIKIKVTYKEFCPCIAEVLKWHESEKAIIYLNEKGLKIMG